MRSLSATSKSISNIFQASFQTPVTFIFLSITTILFIDPSLSKK